MHDCLQIPEILDLILRYVPPEPVAQTARMHLGSCALTCQLFSEAALDIIWNTQTSLVPLLKTLPQHRWRESPNEGFHRHFVSFPSNFIFPGHRTNIEPVTLLDNPVDTENDRTRKVNGLHSADSTSAIPAMCIPLR